MMAVYLWQRSGSLALGGICYCLTITECETYLYRNPSRLLLLTLRERRKTFKIGEKEKINTCFKKTQFDVLLIFCPPYTYVSAAACARQKKLTYHCQTLLQTSLVDLLPRGNAILQILMCRSLNYPHCRTDLVVLQNAPKKKACRKGCLASVRAPFASTQS